MPHLQYKLWFPLQIRRTTLIGEFARRQWNKSASDKSASERRPYNRPWGWLFFFTLIGVSFLGSCTPAPPHLLKQSEVPSIVEADPRAEAVLLVAGDGSAPVFGNAVRYMRDKLVDAGVSPTRLHMLTDEEHIPHNAVASLSNVLNSIRKLNPPQGGSCLVYFTSHGVHHRGLYLANKDEILRPDALDSALLEGCGSKPTTVIVSSCYAGAFVKPPMARENRVIIAASSSERSSFGCSSDNVLTYFDDCLLGSLASTRDWRRVFNDTEQCVALREDTTGMVASQPQAWFGPKVRAFDTSFSVPISGREAEIRFVPGGQNFQPRHVPVAVGDRAIIMPALKQYEHASSPKALAYAPFGFAVFSSAASDWDASADDTARLAVQRCEWLTGGACVLFARDDQTVARLPSGLPPYHPSILRRQGALTAETTPFIRDDQRPKIEAYLKLSGEKALALNPGRPVIGIGQGDTIAAAKRSALTACQLGDTECVIYAENDRVVLSW